jgi:hypothetical protein
MQPDTKLPKQDGDPEILAAIAATEARRNAIKRKQCNEADNDGHTARVGGPVADVSDRQRRRVSFEKISEAEIRADDEAKIKREKRDERKAKVRAGNSKAVTKRIDHPLWTQQQELDAAIAANGGRLTDGLMLQKVGLMAAWKYAKSLDKRWTRNAGYLAAQDELAKIKADEVRPPGTEPQSGFDPAKSSLRTHLYNTACGAIRNSGKAERNVLGVRSNRRDTSVSVAKVFEAANPGDQREFGMPPCLDETAADAMPSAFDTFVVDAATDFRIEQFARAKERLLAEGRLTARDMEIYTKAIAGEATQTELGKEHGLSQSKVSLLIKEVKALFKQAVNSDSLVDV